MIKLGKYITIILWVLLIVSAILVVSLMVNISENEADSIMGGWINTNLVWTYILLGIGAGIAVIGALLQTVSDKAAAKRSLISLGFLVVVAIVAYLLASDAMPTFIGVEKYIADGTLTPKVSKLVGTGLYATYILLFLAIAGIAVSSISRIFK